MVAGEGKWKLHLADWDNTGVRTCVTGQRLASCFDAQHGSAAFQFYVRTSGKVDAMRLFADRMGWAQEGALMGC